MRGMSRSIYRNQPIEHKGSALAMVSCQFARLSREGGSRFCGKYALSMVSKFFDMGPAKADTKNRPNIYERAGRARMLVATDFWFSV